MLQSVDLRTMNTIRVTFSIVGHLDGCLVTSSHQKVGGLWGAQAAQDKDVGWDAPSNA